MKSPIQVQSGASGGDEDLSHIAKDVPPVLGDALAHGMARFKMNLARERILAAFRDQSNRFKCLRFGAQVRALERLLQGCGAIPVLKSERKRHVLFFVLFPQRLTWRLYYVEAKRIPMDMHLDVVQINIGVSSHAAARILQSRLTMHDGAAVIAELISRRLPIPEWTGIFADEKAAWFFRHGVLRTVVAVGVLEGPTRGKYESARAGNGWLRLSGGDDVVRSSRSASGN